MFNYVVGLGQGGSRIASSFSKYFGFPGVYFNFSKVDFSKFNPPGKGGRFVLTDGGTGRDPGVGKELADKYEKDIVAALNKDMKRQSIDKEAVLVCVGGGGGSGCGLIEVIVSHLKSEFKKIFMIYTLPEKREKLPAKPNSLRSLNSVIEDFLKHDYISLLLVDNEYSCRKYASKGFRFEGVNRVLPKAFDRFFKVTDLKNEYEKLDFAKGYNALDFRELKKVMFYSKGFCDIRSFRVEPSWMDMEDRELKKVIRTSSLFVGSFDINTSKIAICSISVPGSYKKDSNVSSLIDRVFDIVGKMTKAPIVFNSSHYDSRIKNMRVDVMLGGLTKSKSLQSLINQALKDQQLLQSKDEVDVLDLDCLS